MGKIIIEMPYGFRQPYFNGLFWIAESGLPHLQSTVSDFTIDGVIHKAEVERQYLIDRMKSKG